MKLIQLFAQKYDPSLSGAIGIVGSMIILGTIAAVPASALIGAGIAAFSGTSALAGALWGGGIVATAAVALVGRIALPQMVYAQCYKHILKKHVAGGGSTSGMKWVPGIENLRPPSRLAQKRGISQLFGKTKTVVKQKNDSSPKQPKNPHGPQS